MSSPLVKISTRTLSLISSGFGRDQSEFRHDLLYGLRTERPCYLCKLISVCCFGNNKRPSTILVVLSYYGKNRDSLLQSLETLSFPRYFTGTLFLWNLYVITVFIFYVFTLVLNDHLYTKTPRQWETVWTVVLQSTLPSGVNLWLFPLKSWSRTPDEVRLEYFFHQTLYIRTRFLTHFPLCYWFMSCFFVSPRPSNTDWNGLPKEFVSVFIIHLQCIFLSVLLLPTCRRNGIRKTF